MRSLGCKFVLQPCGTRFETGPKRITLLRVFDRLITLLRVLMVALKYIKSVILVSKYMKIRRKGLIKGLFINQLTL